MRIIVSLLAIMLVMGCKNKGNQPDISAIDIPLETKRFEKVFFSLDTNNLPAQLEKITDKYKGFGGIFLGGILGIDPSIPIDSISANVNGFIHFYKGIYDTTELVFSDFSPYEKEIKDGLRHIKYYFPEQSIPKKIITYISPFYLYLDQPVYKNWCDFFPAKTRDTLMIGLNYYLGDHYSKYSELLPNYIYPEYITRQFTPKQIPIDCIKTIIDDIYPNLSFESSLLVQMVEKGKRLYLLNKLLPQKEEYLLIGYSQDQLKACYDHERDIWNLFIKNNYLQSIEPGVIKNYVSEGPKTQELGEDAPGNIGSFAGWQIVKHYAEKYPEVPLQQLMKEDAEIIFEKSKYKP